MFTNISWTTYLMMIGLATIGWYFALVLLHHYKGLKSLLSGRRNLTANHLYDSFDPNAESSTSIGHTVPKGEFDEPAPQDFEIIEELVEHVKLCIGDAREKLIPKDDVYILLRNLLKDYPSLKTSHFRPSVSEFIAGESLEQGLEGISIEEVEKLW